jgi:hypothetical protein
MLSDIALVNDTGTEFIMNLKFDDDTCVDDTCVDDKSSEETRLSVMFVTSEGPKSSIPDIRIIIVDIHIPV